MLLIQGKLVSEEIVEEAFVCNLNACKGACCWEGDFGAPLEEAELDILKAIQNALAPYLTEKGMDAIKKQGPFQWSDEAGHFGTTLVENGPCAYMTYAENGIAQCGIEQAWKAGVVEFRKPVSCHLYPIRVMKNPVVDFEALNYDRWDICSAACELGKELKVPVYRFLKEALVRKYGQEFYDELDIAAQHLLAGGKQE